jgi:hypothetical protein
MVCAVDANSCVKKALLRYAIANAVLAFDDVAEPGPDAEVVRRRGDAESRRGLSAVSVFLRAENDVHLDV